MRPCVCNALRHVSSRPHLWLMQGGRRCLYLLCSRETTLARLASLISTSRSRLDCVSAGSKGSAYGSSHIFFVGSEPGSRRLPGSLPTELGEPPQAADLTPEVLPASTLLTVRD